MHVGKKAYRIQAFVGDRMTVEVWAYEDSERDMAWLEQWKENARTSSHPLHRCEITEFTEGATEVVKPDNPLSLQDAVGP